VEKHIAGVVSNGGFRVSSTVVVEKLCEKFGGDFDDFGLGSGEGS
jgi:hypothetical protein